MALDALEVHHLQNIHILDKLRAERMRHVEDLYEAELLELRQTFENDALLLRDKMLQQLYNKQKLTTTGMILIISLQTYNLIISCLCL